MSLTRNFHVRPILDVAVVLVDSCIEWLWPNILMLRFFNTNVVEWRQSIPEVSFDNSGPGGIRLMWDQGANQVGPEWSAARVKVEPQENKNWYSTCEAYVAGCRTVRVWTAMFILVYGRLPHYERFLYLCDHVENQRPRTKLMLICSRYQVS